MEQIGHLYLYSLVGLAIIVFLVACVGFLAALHDRRLAQKRLVTQSVRCPQRQDDAVVTFVERGTRRAVRIVESCSLLDVGERCSEACARLRTESARRSARVEA